MTLIVVEKSDSWNMTLLLMVLDEHKNFDYVKFADDGDEIYCDEKIHSIGNLDNLIRSFMSGRVVYQFEGFHQNDLNLDFSEVEKTYKHGASLKDRVLFHRTVHSVA